MKSWIDYHTFLCTSYVSSTGFDPQNEFLFAHTNTAAVFHLAPSIPDFHELAVSSNSLLTSKHVPLFLMHYFEISKMMCSSCACSLQSEMGT